MNIQTNFAEDARHQKETPGAYEWWYFDWVDPVQELAMVVILYEGNPFSRRYMEALKKGNKPQADQYPAISISVYQKGEHIYYSFTEFEPDDAAFESSKPQVTIGNHSMTVRQQQGNLVYDLELNETLPDGTGFDATLQFLGSAPDSTLLTTSEAEVDEAADHTWNLALPRCSVTGTMHIHHPEQKEPDRFEISAVGYHDHNRGDRPMKDEFTDWYWGRFHFKNATLVCYVMHRKGGDDHRAWLIGNKGQEVLAEFDSVGLDDKNFNMFGLEAAHRLTMQGSGKEVNIHCKQVVDNGPFYRRYLAEAIMFDQSTDHIERTTGIAEYIRPKRIHNRLFWPLVNMRIQYKVEAPHWVQRSPKLYRWTW